MAVIALSSAHGAPGVTTLALAMTMQWPRPVMLAECDVASGSSILAGRLRGKVEPDRGLVELALSHRRRQLVESDLWAQTIPLAKNEERFLLPAPPEFTQAAAAASIWQPLAGVFTGLERGGIDVLVDAGRLSTQHGPRAVLDQADLVAIVLRSDLPAVNAVRSHVSTLRAELGENEDTIHGRLVLLVVGQGKPFQASTIAEAVGLPVVASIDFDPVAAEVYSSGAEPGRRFNSSPLITSTRAAISHIQRHVHQRRMQLHSAYGTPLPDLELRPEQTNV